MHGQGNTRAEKPAASCILRFRRGAVMRLKLGEPVASAVSWLLLLLDANTPGGKHRTKIQSRNI